MARPKRDRTIRCLPHTTYFKPQGIPRAVLEEITLSLDELESLRLADLQGLNQGLAASEMGVSRQTFGRVVSTARAKIARALIQGKALRVVDGGPVELAQPIGQRATTKVAVALSDAGLVSRHFGRAARFLVYRIVGGTLVEQETRNNPHIDRRRGQPALRHRRQATDCNESPGRSAGRHCGDGPHRWIDETLGDCSALITAGVGAAANGALRAAGIRVVILDRPMDPADALELYLEGRL